MRRFRAIVETRIEPQDHEVLWFNKGKLLYWANEAWEPFLLVDSYEIPYQTEEDENIGTVQDALDKLLYVPPKITTFSFRESGVYESGTRINSVNISWSYNKKLMKEQKINNTIIPISVRQYSITLDTPITSNTSYTLYASDGTNSVSASSSISFKDYMYYGTSMSEGKVTKRSKLNPSVGGCTVTSNAGEYVWIFLPRSSGFTKIWYNNVDSTDDFVKTSMTFETDTNISVAGTMYVSKNHSLNNVSLKFT